jgi:hypothetical protein
VFVEKTFSSRVRRIMLLVVLAWLVGGGIVFVGIPAWKADQAFSELSYGARVDSIVFNPGHRGHPSVLIKNEWRFFTIDEMKVVPILQVGDSLVKIPDSRILRVYRKKADTYDLVESLE